MSTKLSRWVVAPAALCLLLGPVTATAQTEGYDPLLQISHQFAHPNMMILQDVTGSMAYSQTGGSGSSVVDSFGLPTFSWNTTSQAVQGDQCSTVNVGGNSCSTRSPCYSWTTTGTYSLRQSVQPPSRMDVLKNALGNSVALFSSPTITWPSSWPKSYTGYTYNGAGKWTGAATSCSRTAPSAPGAPFTAAWDATPDYSTTPPTTPTIQTWDPGLVPRLPQNLVGTSKEMINWGLMTFSTSGISVLQNVLADDTLSVQTTAVNNILAYLKPAALGGLDAGGNTSTSEALNHAKAALSDTYNKLGPGGTLASPKPDDKILCNRIYGVLLVTDGQSNMCNSSGSPCGSSTYWSCETATGTNSLASWTNFPAGRANEIFLKTQDTTTACSSCRTTDNTPVATRTFVIGVSSEVARCELNLVAYFGRTDANSPKGDAGMNIAGDYTGTAASPTYRLPLNVSDASPVSPLTSGTSTTTGNYRKVAVSCTPSATTVCSDYAFFANDPAALAEAVATIIGAVAAGDYTTSAPVATSVVGAGTVSVIASTEFPAWKGHLYAFDRNKTPGTAGYVKWDAGWNLTKSVLPADDTATPWAEGATANPAYVAPSARKIYTWNSSNVPVQVTTDTAKTTLATLQGICNCPVSGTDPTSLLTAKVVNFIMGYDGSSATSTQVRPWVLGSSINGTPAITQTPEKFLQGKLEDHTSFEKSMLTPGNRTPLVWIGADDGMLHAFQFADGKEAFAILPPDLLHKQADLLAKYNAVTAPTGQPALLAGHIYGIAGSARYGDMYDGSVYRTVMLLTEGPGGTLIAGLDVTDPVLNAKTVDPFSVLWSKQGGTDWPYLFNSWSTPAAGASVGYDKTAGTHSTWKGIVGAGFNSLSSKGSQVQPKTLMFNPLTGAASSTLATDTLTSPSAFVGNQTFADSVIYSMSADEFHADNIDDLALQADLNGRIWFIPGPDFNTAAVGISATAKIVAQGTSQQQPIYYPPAVNAYKSNAGSFDLYAFGSGTVYEQSSQVTGSNIGSSGYFIPSLYLAGKAQTTAAITDLTQIARIPIGELYVPEWTAASLALTPPTPACPTGSTVVTNVGNWKQALCSGVTPHKLVGARSQLTAAPNIFVPAFGAGGSPVALFLIYDPDAASSCAGYSYIVSVSFDVSSTGVPTISGTSVFGAGAGAASGFAVAGGNLVIAKSGVGPSERASVGSVPGITLNPTKGLAKPQPVWWRELK